jgi:UDP:flavonoid glycosyltransferase YjiC (YdhE family)
MQAVVHHGGAGVMWECLRAGVPQLVLPQDYDQFDHAARLEAAGVGVRLRAAREVGHALETCLASDNAAKAQVWMQAVRPRTAETRLQQRVRQQFGV